MDRRGQCWCCEKNKGCPQGRCCLVSCRSGSMVRFKWNSTYYDAEIFKMSGKPTLLLSLWCDNLLSASKSIIDRLVLPWEVTLILIQLRVHRIKNMYVCITRQRTRTSEIYPHLLYIWNVFRLNYTETVDPVKRRMLIPAWLYFIR